jgi:aarF domain-containing kinase
MISRFACASNQRNHILSYACRLYGTYECNKKWLPLRRVIKWMFLLGTGTFIMYKMHKHSNLSKIDDSYTLTLFKQHLEGVRRFSYTFFVMIRVGIDYKLHYSDDLSSKSISEIHLRNADRLLAMFNKNGGIYVKIGQYLASLNNVLPREYTDTLSILQDKAPTVSLSELQETFIQCFGNTTDQLFAEFDTTPLAAASIAQVHRAKLFDGQQVAVKVQYPSIANNFTGDTKTISFILALLPIFFTHHDFSWTGPELTECLAKELDFTIEASNMKKAAQMFAHRQDIYIPKVIESLTCPRILTMEFIKGIKVNDVEGIKVLGLSVKEACRITMEAFAEMTYIHGYLHSDPHPGNIFVRPMPGHPKNVQVVILDHGLYRYLDDRFRTNYAKLWKALVLKDDENVRKYCLRFGINDYKLYGAIVLMRSYSTAEAGLFDHHTLEEVARFKEEFSNKLSERILDALNLMPREMLLVMRTNSLLRALNQELGVPVNRHIINARIAAKGIHKCTDNISLRNKIKNLWESVGFEVRIRYWEWRNYITVMIYRVAIAIGLMKPIRLTINKDDVDVIIAA